MSRGFSFSLEHPSFFSSAFPAIGCLDKEELPSVVSNVYKYIHDASAEENSAFNLVELSKQNYQEREGNEGKEIAPKGEDIARRNV